MNKLTKKPDGASKTEFMPAADMMKHGVAINISDIKPDSKIGSEIFPNELTSEA